MAQSAEQQNLITGGKLEIPHIYSLKNGNFNWYTVILKRGNRECYLLMMDGNVSPWQMFNEFKQKHNFGISVTSLNRWPEIKNGMLLVLNIDRIITNDEFTTITSYLQSKLETKHFNNTFNEDDGAFFEPSVGDDGEHYHLLAETLQVDSILQFSDI